MSEALKITAVTCVKNEGPFLLEWIAYNQVLGVTDFLFYSNDCSDGTDTLLDKLAEHDVVRHLPNPAVGRNYQMEALRHAYRQRIVTKADWVWIHDVDEFLNIHIGQGTIPELIAACGNPAAISVPWQFMANSGVLDFVDRPVISQFFGTHNPDLWTNTFQMDVKTLVRRDLPMHFVGVHRPFVKPDTPREAWPSWTDGSGRPVGDRFKMIPVTAPVRSFDMRGARGFATLNHYALRSLDSYLVKNDRGDVNREDRAFDTSYWQDRNDAIRQDDTILRYLPRLTAQIGRLMALGGIADLHQTCVARHAAKCAELLTKPAYQQLREDLRALPLVSAAEISAERLLA